MGFSKKRIISRDEVIPFGVIVAIVLFLLWGCQKGMENQDVQEDSRLVARVNDYNIYVSDVAHAVKLSAPSGKFSMEDLGDEETKRDLLDELITKKVLVQEAGRGGFDREKEFMREIEKYWEQALIKFLLEEKSREIAGSLKINNSDIEEEYARRKKRVLVELVIMDEGPKAEELARAGDRFDKVKESFKESIILEQAPEWRESGDLPEDLEGRVFFMNRGETTEAVSYDGNWAVLRVLDVGEKEMPPLEEVREEIRRDIVKTREEEMLDDWISELKKGAKVKIDEDTLESIDLKELYYREK